jgi:hypothetical protein
MPKTLFEGVRVYGINFGYFRRGAAVTIPGIGIFVGPRDLNNVALLRHEFGHILQYRKWGFLFFWFRIAPVSLVSAWRSRISGQFDHMETWTERLANGLSDRYFRKLTNCQ